MNYKSGSETFFRGVASPEATSIVTHQTKDLQLKKRTAEGLDPILPPKQLSCKRSDRAVEDYASAVAVFLVERSFALTRADLPERSRR